MIADKRRYYKESNERLRRARRLYKYLVAKPIFDNPELVFVVAVRAINAGLYSKKTILKDVVFSLATYAERQKGYKFFGKRSALHGIWWFSSDYFKCSAGSYKQIKKIRIKLPIKGE